MSFLKFARNVAVAFCLFLSPFMVFGQDDFATDGGEYSIAGAQPGDQVHPDVAVGTQGGFVVWQDNITDGSGLGVSALRLDSSFSALYSPFRVNGTGAQDQQNPQVALLKDDGAVFVWQGGAQGFQQIYARFFNVSTGWVTGDILVSGSTSTPKSLPAVAVLTNGNAVVVWGSYEDAASGNPQYQDIIGQVLSPSGEKIGSSFRLNQVTDYSQHNASVAALGDGRAIVAWVSDQQQGTNSVDVFGRFLSSEGTPVGNEFLMSTNHNVCAYPSVAAAPDGGFMAVWSENAYNLSNRWDIISRRFSGTGSGGVQRTVNTYLYSDQIGGKVSAAGDAYLAVWTSYSQDGSWEGVYGQFLSGDGSPSGGELHVPSTAIGPQMQPAVSGDGAKRFLAVWTSGEGGINSQELKAQRYVNVSEPLLPLDAPFVTALSSNALSVTWSALEGYDVAHYFVYADGAATPTVTITNNWWTMSGLASQSTHSFQVAYQLEDGRKSPISESSTGTTYLALSYFGVPIEWMNQYSWPNGWPLPDLDTDGDGMSNRKEFLAGTDPTDPASVLRTRIESTPQGNFLHWPTVPGSLYQVQYSTDMSSWSDMGGIRFAAGTEDTMHVHVGQQGFYQVLKVW